MRQRVLAGFREALQQGLRARIVVPTATLAEHLRHELVRGGLVFRARDVGTLAQFVRELVPQTETVTPELFQLMVQDALRRLELPAFQKVAELPGFQARLTKTIGDLDASGCTAGQLESHYPEHEVSAIWQDVEHQMRARNLVMRGESLRLAAQAARERRPADRIWFEGFAQLSRPEKELMDALRVSVETVDEASGGPAKTVLVVPDTAEREVEEIARRIRGSQPFREIGVILRKPEKYLSLLRAAFDRFAIPAHFYFNEPLLPHPAARLVTGIVEALLAGWEHERVLEFIPFIPRVGMSDALDAFAMEVREKLPGRGVDALLEIAGSRVLPQRVLLSLQQIDAWKRERRTPSEWAARLSHLSSLFWPGRVPDRIAPAATERYRSHAAGLKAFANAMESAACWWLDGHSAIDLEAFWQVARSVLRLSMFQTEPRSRNVVHVISAWEARQWDLSTLFVCGMVEKDFPAQNARDPFFSDAALRSLGARTSQEKDEQEVALFEEVRAGARDLLVLSYPRTDSRGQRNLKSIFLTGCTEAEVPAAVRPLLPPPVAAWQQASRIHSEDLRDALSVKHAKAGVTALEDLLQCPFLFFARRTLRIHERPCRPEERLDFLTQGIIAHDVLREWFDSPQALEPLYTRVFASVCDQRNIQPGFRNDRLRRLILVALQQFTANQQYPRNLKSQTEQAFEVSIDEGFRISGRFDRVDELEDGRSVVIDYKFSAKASTKKRLSDETKLQGPLYAWAAQEQYGRAISAMIYISLKGGEKPEYSGWGEVPGAQVTLLPIPENWIPQALERAANAMAEFRAGVIRPRPANQDPCRYCTYRDACRVEQPAAMPAAGV